MYVRATHDGQPTVPPPQQPRIQQQQQQQQPKEEAARSWLSDIFI